MTPEPERRSLASRPLAGTGGPGQETGGALPGGYRQRPVITWLSCYGFSVARAWLACTAALVALAGALELAANGL